MFLVLTKFGLSGAGDGIDEISVGRRLDGLSTSPPSRLDRRAAMSSELPDQSSGKPRKRLAAKAAKPQAASKVKSTIHLTVESSQRLTVHAAMLGMDRSALVELLIK